MSAAADDSAAAPAAADAEPSAPRAPATAHVLAQAVLDFEEGDAQVRFDEAARRLVLIKHKEFVAMPLAAPAGDARGRSEAQQVIRCENRGKVENVRFSLNHRFVAVQRSDVELELLDLLLGNAFTHLCKGGGSKQRWRILNFQWTGTPVADFLVVTTAGIELYLVLPDKKALKLVKRVEHAVACRAPRVAPDRRGPVVATQRVASVDAAAAGGAEGSAQLHERLIEIPRSIPDDEAFGFAPESLRRRPVAERRIDREESCEHATHVAVDHRLFPTERDAADRPCGIATDSREAAASVDILGNRSVVGRNHFTHATME